MSHIAKLETKFTDKECLKKALDRLNIKHQDVTNYKFFDGSTKSGLMFQLPNWRYPVVVDENNEAYFDNYNGHWGSMSEMANLKTYYGVEKSKKAARIAGRSCREVMVEGKPQVRISVG